MIADYSAEIKIAIFQSVFETPTWRMKIVVKLRGVSRQKLRVLTA